MTNLLEPETPRRNTMQKPSDEDVKLVEKARRRGTATDILGTMVYDDTEQVDIEDLLDVPLVLIEYKPAEGKYGEFVVIHLCAPDTYKHLSTITGGQVVVRKVKKLEDSKSLPCMVTIVKVKDYYDLQ